MNEASLVRNLVATLRVSFPGSIVFKHADRVTAGIPDISVTWKAKTVWLEVKYANPRIHSRGIQSVIINRMSGVGQNVWYVIFHKSGIYMVKPINLERWQEDFDGKTDTESDYEFVTQFLLKAAF